MNNQGKKYIGHPATLQDFKNFITECFIEDQTILEHIDSFMSDDPNAKDPASTNTWEIYQICTDNEDFKSIGCIFYPLEIYFDNAEHWGGYDLYYDDPIDQKAIIQVATMWMPYYDTKYRINVFDTIDGYLLLGINEPD